LGSVLVNKGGEVEGFVVIRRRGNYRARVRIRVGALSGEEHELLIAIGPVLAEVEEGDGDEEEDGDLDRERCPEKIASHWGFHDSIHGSTNNGFGLKFLLSIQCFTKIHF